MSYLKTNKRLRKDVARLTGQVKWYDEALDTLADTLDEANAEAEQAEAALAKMTDAAETLAGMASAAWSDEAQAAAGEVLRVARAEERSEDE